MSFNWREITDYEKTRSDWLGSLSPGPLAAKRIRGWSLAKPYFFGREDDSVAAPPQVGLGPNEFGMAVLLLCAEFAKHGGVTEDLLAKREVLLGMPGAKGLNLDSLEMLVSGMIYASAQDFMFWQLSDGRVVVPTAENFGAIDGGYLILRFGDLAVSPDQGTLDAVQLYRDLIGVEAALLQDPVLPLEFVFRAKLLLTRLTMATRTLEDAVFKPLGIPATKHNASDTRSVNGKPSPWDKACLAYWLHAVHGVGDVGLRERVFAGELSGYATERCNVVKRFLRKLPPGHVHSSGSFFGVMGTIISLFGLRHLENPDLL